MLLSKVPRNRFFSVLSNQNISRVPSLIRIPLATDFSDPDAFDRRLPVRPRHLDNTKKSKEFGFLLTGGAILADHDKGEMIGSMMVFEAESEEQVREAVEQDPYVIEKVWERYEIIPIKM
ncbi:2655_t:CDS:2 [Acaulospora morrowiae]|uniref:2655_t:CDS:1 n=1 Tax=Acaulospora morrowiae TaxID=94023 RepID=A0A9N9FUA4_9GLOM|nr:2655_t:CDS:2 [Acaulospora morrowiae]